MGSLPTRIEVGSVAMPTFVLGAYFCPDVAYSTVCSRVSWLPHWCTYDVANGTRIPCVLVARAY
eukprot:1009804-Rhodomonas_salina.6